MINKEKKFSNVERSATLLRCSQQSYDLIVIGGGITGAGIALDASLRGLRTLLLEKQDFASGTSSKSTKLIHGGLRYLKQLEFGLVRETGLERAVAHRNIPHLVHPETMLLPIVKNGTFNKYSASLAISVYDWMAGVPKKDRKKSLSKRASIAKEPLLRDDILKSAIAYSEYRTDDARLTIELIKAARREGGEAINYMKVESFVSEEGRITGVRCKDMNGVAEYTFEAKAVVSAAGPWVDTLRVRDEKITGKSLRLTKGVHIVVSKDKLPIHRAVYFDAFDGRMLFAIPRGNVTYIGTSDTAYDGDLNRVLCSMEDVNYLLAGVNQMFKGIELNVEDVESSWAGLRPLIHEEGKSPTELSRKDEIFISNRGLISIAGGKLTGYRKMAERLVNLVQKKNDIVISTKTKTKKYQIHVDSFHDYQAFIDHYRGLAQEYESNGLTLYYSWYLVSTYGKSANWIISNALATGDRLSREVLIQSEIDFCIQFESVLLPDDYFNRRSGKLFFDIQDVLDYFDIIMDKFQAYFEWSDEKKLIEADRCRQLIQDISVFKSNS